MGDDLLLLAVAFVMVLAACFSPYPSLYLRYGEVLRHTATAIRNHHAVVSFVSVLCAFLAAVKFMSARNGAGRVTALVALSAAVWVNGKRYIVAMASLWLTAGVCRCLRKARLRAAFLVAVIGGLALYHVAYLRFVRGYGGGLYEAYRLEWCRDAGIKMALYKELDEAERPILEYRGQSILYTLVFWLPRSLWADKPYPYWVYFTAAVLDLPSQRSLAGWGVTNCWLDEAIANFGILGMALGIALPGMICRRGPEDAPRLWLAKIGIGCCMMSADVAGWLGVALAGAYFGILNILPVRRGRHWRAGHPRLPTYKPSVKGYASEVPHVCNMPRLAIRSTSD